MAFISKRMTHNDGKMHHLGIDENDIAQTVILTANMEDVLPITTHLDNAEKTGLYREYLTYTGEKDGVPLSVMSTGIGCMPMAIAVEELNHIGAKNLIKVGVGAAIQPGIKPGTLLIPTSAVRGEGATLEYVNYQYPAVSDMILLKILEETAREFDETPEIGIFRSHDSYYTESPYANDGGDRIKKWTKLGVKMIEHEISSMLVISSILELKAGAIYVVSENYEDNTRLSEEELKKRLDACYKIVVAAAKKLK